MKLTFSIAGGFTGQAKEKSIDVESLDEKTQELLMRYFEEHRKPSLNSNVMETWTLNQDQEVSVQRQQLPEPLKVLYDYMKEHLSYVKR